MSDQVQVITDEFICDIAEMGGPDTLTSLVKLDQATIERIKQDDPDPQFATFVVTAGKSRNGRNWRPEIFQKVAETINSSAEGDPVVGYLGHIDEKDAGTAFPPIQLQWLKGRINVMSDKTQGIFKAYVLPKEIPGSVGREYIKRGFVKTISWAGKATMRPMKGGGLDVIDFDLESMDLSRPRKAGMSAVLVGGLTSEMDNDDGGNSVKPEEITALQPNELHAHAPALVKQIEDAATEPLNTRITEMEATIEHHAPVVQMVENIRKALGLDEKGDVLEALGTVIAKSKEVGKGATTKFLDAVLGKKFKDEATRTLVRKLIVSEMESEDGRQYVTEMVAAAEDDDTLKVKTEEIVTKIIDTDPDLKKMVAEMDGGSGRTFQQTVAAARNGGWEIKAGYENDRIRVVKAGRR